jgi:hypothetical protein
LELKTQDKQGRPVGKPHGRQKTFIRDNAVSIGRSMPVIRETLDQFIKDAESLRIAVQKEELAFWKTKPSIKRNS